MHPPFPTPSGTRNLLALFAAPRRWIFLRALALGIAGAGATVAFGSEPVASPQAPRGEASAVATREVAAPEGSGFVFALLPKAFQRRPLMDFNVVTEMTQEGRKLAAPTPENPAYYVQQSGKFVQTGSSFADAKHLPPVADLEQAMQRSLSAAGYRVAAPDGPKAGLLVIFNYGASSIDPPLPVLDGERTTPVSAQEWLPYVAQDATLLRDVLARAELVGGQVFAGGFRRALEREMENRTINWMARKKVVSVSPDFDSPYEMYVSGSPKAWHLVEHAFHTVYFVIASAYDYDAMQQGQRRLLWRTKMTVDAQGVNMRETLVPMIASASPYFGRDMTEFEFVSKRISREGRVEIGTATVVEDRPGAEQPEPARDGPKAAEAVERK